MNADCTLFTMGPRNLRLMSLKCSLSWASPNQLSRGRVNWFLNFPRCFILPKADKPRMPQVTIRRPFGELDLD